MRARARGLLVAAGLAVAFGELTPVGQVGTAETHIAAAKAAAGTDHAFMFETLCVQALAGLNQPAAPPAVAAQGRGAQPAGPPARATWHAEPVKVFDNLYFVGQTGVLRLGGHDVGGHHRHRHDLRLLGRRRGRRRAEEARLDPAQIKYAIVSHGHGDHSGGAKFLQDTFGTRIILSAADWDLLDRSTGTKPKRDMVATDGQKLTLGDTTLTLYITPGHTLGTISTIIPGEGRRHSRTSSPSGAARRSTGCGNRRRTSRRSGPTSSGSKPTATRRERFRDIAAQAGADVLIANHTNFDGIEERRCPRWPHARPATRIRTSIGKDAVQRYLHDRRTSARRPGRS